MIALFSTSPSDIITVNINGLISTYQVPRRIWTIIDKLDDRNQIFNLKSVDKVATLQIYSGSWEGGNKPFDDETIINFISSSGVQLKKFNVLANLLSGKIGKPLERVVPSSVNINSLIDKLGADILGYGAAFNSDGDELKLNTSIYSARVAFISHVYAIFDKYLDINFNNEKHAPFWSYIQNDKIGTFINNDLAKADLINDKIIFRSGSNCDVELKEANNKIKSLNGKIVVFSDADNIIDGIKLDVNKLVETLTLASNTIKKLKEDARNEIVLGARNEIVLGARNDSEPGADKKG